MPSNTENLRNMARRLRESSLCWIDLLNSTAIRDRVNNTIRELTLEDNKVLVALKAIIEDDIETLQLSIDRISNLKSQFDNGATLLHFAVLANAQGCVKLLLANKVSINAVEQKSKLTALHLAVILGHSEIADTLLMKKSALTHSEKINGERYTAFDLAQVLGHGNIVKSIRRFNELKLKSKRSDFYVLTFIATVFSFITAGIIVTSILLTPVVAFTLLGISLMVTWGLLNAIFVAAFISSVNDYINANNEYKMCHKDLEQEQIEEKASKIYQGIQDIQDIQGIGLDAREDSILLGLIVLMTGLETDDISQALGRNITAQFQGGISQTVRELNAESGMFPSRPLFHLRQGLGEEPQLSALPTGSPERLAL